MGVPVLMASSWKASRKRCGEGTGFAGADDAAVERHDGNDFRRGAGEETFVGGENVIAGERALHDGNAEFAGEFDDHGAGDAVERAIADERSVAACRFS